MQDKRRQEIASLVNRMGSVRVAELADIFDMSKMTIHRDLDYLEEHGVLKRKRGGAVSNFFSEMVRYSYRSTNCLEEKQEIASKVYDLIEQDDTLFIDGSTTALEVAKLLNGGERVTVFTHSPLVLNELLEARNVMLYSIGSYYDRDMVHFIGADVEEKISRFNFSKCVVGAGAISESMFFSDPYPQLASIKTTIIRSSATSIVVADNTKFGKIALQNFASLSEVDCIVTDSGVSKEHREYFSEAIQII